VRGEVNMATVEEGVVVMKLLLMLVWTDVVSLLLSTVREG